MPNANDMYTQGLPAIFANNLPDPAFAKSKVDPTDIGKGIGSAFGVISIRGKVFRIKHRGEEYPVVIPGTQNAAPTLDIIVIKASPVISKIWYEGQFVEGSRDAPDCFSVNGLTPDPASPKKQGNFCASCPQNGWGSKTVNGKAAKACQDNKRLAVVPFLDPLNETFGGPMLLRIPPASLQDMSAYNQLLQQYHHSYYTVGTQLRFDIDTAHPKLLFAPIQPITGEIARLVVELQDHPQVHRMLTEGVEYAKAEDPAIAAGQPAPPTPGGVPGTPPPAPPTSPPPPPMPPPRAAAPPDIQTGAAPGTGPQPAVFQTAAPMQASPARPQTAPQDALAPPAFLDRTQGFQQQAAVPPQPQAPSVEELQRQLAEVNERLAAAGANKPRRGGRPRATPPPSPAPATIEGQAQPAQPQQPPQPLQTAQPMAVTAAQPPQAGGVAFGAPAQQVAPGTTMQADPTQGQLPAGMDNMLQNLIQKTKPN